MTTQAYLVHFSDRVLNGLVQGIEDLTLDELHFRPHEHCNSVAFDAWHIFRTADNIVHFVFEREQPLWLQQGLDEQWGLPKVAQGTGMEPEEAHALRFPEAERLAQYGHDVRDAVRSRVEAMSDEYLQTVNRVVPWGEITRLEAIGQTIISHGNGHLGQIDLARTMLDRPGLGI